MRTPNLLAGLAAASSFFLLTACDWASGGDENSFNSTREANNVNHSGFYTGTFVRTTTNVVGGVTNTVEVVRAVSRSSGAIISTFAIIHNGNILEITDNNGTKYQGRNGSPLAVAARPSPGTEGEETPPIPDAVLATANQIWWEGTDRTSGRKIDFIGIMRNGILEGTWYESGGITSMVSAERGAVDEAAP